MLLRVSPFAAGVDGTRPGRGSARSGRERHHALRDHHRRRARRCRRARGEGTRALFERNDRRRVPDQAGRRARLGVRDRHRDYRAQEQGRPTREPQGRQLGELHPLTRGREALHPGQHPPSDALRRLRLSRRRAGRALPDPRGQPRAPTADAQGRHGVENFQPQGRAAGDMGGTGRRVDRAQPHERTGLLHSL